MTMRMHFDFCPLTQLNVNWTVFAQPSFLYNTVKSKLQHTVITQITLFSNAEVCVILSGQS